MKLGLPKDLVQKIMARRSALIFEASLSGRPVDAAEAQRQAVNEVVQEQKVARGLVSNPAQESWLAGKAALERLSREMEGMESATPSPALESEVVAGIAEFESEPCAPGLRAFWEKINRMALHHARSWRKPSPPAPRATTVEPVAEPQSASKRSVKKTKLPPTPPVDRVAGPLVIVRGGSSTTKWIGGDVPDHSSYES